MPTGCRRDEGCRVLKPDRPAVPRALRQLLPYLLLGAGLIELPWLLFLADQLPSATNVQHWAVVWVGLDAVEAIGLIVTGLLYRRGDPRAALTAVATATLLLADAWIDVTTSRGDERLVALGMAALIEVPLALICLYATRNGWHRQDSSRPR
jgi:hypothetical protein